MMIASTASRIARLNIDFVDHRIEFGAYSSFHFHRLNDAEGFTEPDHLPGGHANRFDETRHRTSQKVGPSAWHFLRHEQGELRLPPRVDARVRLKAAVHQMSAVENGRS